MRILSLAMCLVSVAAAQTTSTITGRVLDASGATLSGAKVTARHVDTGFAWAAATLPDGSYVLNVAEVPSTYLLNSSGGWIGRRTTPHAAANGKVLLAHGAIPVPRELERYTAHTITTQAELTAALAAVRRNGYATAVAELEEGLVAVAAPVLDGTGACVAALSISGPAFRMRPESLDELGQLCAGA